MKPSIFGDQTSIVHELHAIKKRGFPTRATIIKSILDTVAARESFKSEDPDVITGPVVFQQLGELIASADSRLFLADERLSALLKRLSKELRVAENRAQSGVNLLEPTEWQGLCSVLKQQSDAIGKLRQRLESVKGDGLKRIANILRFDLHRLEYEVLASAYSIIRNDQDSDHGWGMSKYKRRGNTSKTALLDPIFERESGGRSHELAMLDRQA